MRGCTVWCDWGRALEIGAETCADEYRNILFENCDIIRCAHYYLDIQNGDRAWVHDVVFRDIRCEYSRYALPPVYQHDMNAPYPVPKEPYVPALIASPIYNGPGLKTIFSGGQASSVSEYFRPRRQRAGRTRT